MAGERYNLARYNLSGSAIREMDFSINASETIEAVAGGRIYESFQFIASETIHGSVELRSLISFSMDDSEKILSEVTPHLHVLSFLHALEDMNARALMGKDINTNIGFTENIQANAHLGKVIPHGLIAQEYISGRTHLGKRIPINIQSLEVIDSVVAMGFTRYAIASINVTIPAGGEIRINSDVFTAVMGLTNILHLYSGDWIFFDRDTTQLIVEAGSGGSLSGEVFYTDRYL